MGAKGSKAPKEGAKLIEDSSSITTGPTPTSKELGKGNKNQKVIPEPVGPTISSYKDALKAWPAVENCKLEFPQTPEGYAEAGKIMDAFSRLYVASSLISEADSQILNREFLEANQNYEKSLEAYNDIFKDLNIDEYSDGLKLHYLLVRQKQAFIKVLDGLEEQGLSFYSEHFEKFKFKDGTLEQAGCFNFLGFLQLSSKKFSEAAESYKKAIEIRKKLLLKGKRYILGDSHEGLGLVYLEEKKYKEALAEFGRANSTRAKLNKFHVSKIRVLGLQGQVYFMQENWKKAFNILKNAVTKYDKIYIPNHAEYFEVIENAKEYADVVGMIKMNPKFFKVFEYIYITSRLGYSSFRKGKNKVQAKKDQDDKEAIDKIREINIEKDTQAKLNGENAKQKFERKRIEKMEEDDRRRKEDKKTSAKKREAKVFLRKGFDLAVQIHDKYYQVAKAEEIKYFGECLSERTDL